MEENALSGMSLRGVDRYSPSVSTGDAALEHRRWLEFGLGTNAKRFAPIRQGEGVSRTISGNSKERSVLWRVFLCYLSSREERWHPRRAFPFEKRQIGSGIVGFCAAFPTALQQSLRCPCGHHLPLHKGGFGASKLRWYGERLNLPCRTPLSAQLTSPLTGEPRSALTEASPERGGGKISDFAGGVIQSSRRDTTTARQGDFIRCRKANALGVR